MYKSWYKRIGYAFVLMMAVIMITGTKAYAIEETQPAVVMNPLYQEDVTEIEIELESLQGEMLESSDEIIYTSIEEAAKYMRGQMVVRNTSFSIKLSSDIYQEYGEESFNTVLDKAVEHTEECSGQEGDALNYCWSGCKLYTYNLPSGEVRYVAKFQYHTNAEQEEALTVAINSAMETLSLDGKSEYTKVKAIHRYICNHVDYDNENLYDDSYKLKYSAYAAMINKTSVCQGYAILFYRMCKEADLSVRIITGIGSEQRHAWNIVKIGDYYYNIDCTWDGQGKETYYSYFLKSEDRFGNHTRNAEYDTVEFHNQYPMATESYKAVVGDGEDLENPNYTYTTIKDTAVTSTANGKPKLLIFYETDCICSILTFRDLQGSYIGDVDIICIECTGSTKEEVAAYADEYGSHNMQFCYNTTSTLSLTSLQEYIYVDKGNQVCTDYPIIAYIDAANRLQYISYWEQTVGDIQNNIIIYCGTADVLSVPNENIIINNGDTHSITVYEDGIRCDGDVFDWNSSDTEVVTVDKYGKITGVAEGKATITCKASDGRTLTVAVTVTAPKENGLIYTNGKYVWMKDGVKDTSKTGLVPFDGQWFYIVKGEMSNFSGFVKYDGETFYVAAGRMVAEASGLVEYNGEWYFVASGRVVSEYTGLAEYNGAWFYVANGKMDTTKKGMVEYNGGLFYVGAGKIMKHVSGLAQDPVTGKWYFLAEGQVQKQHTGLALYDGKWFYVIKGEFAIDYTGTVTHDGSKFYVVKGEVQL